MALAADTTNGIQQADLQPTLIYPNRVCKGQTFTVKGIPGESSQLQITDLKGRLHLQQNITENTQISTNQLEPGIYMVSISTRNNHYDQRLMVL
ncbi:MAG: T9SS type A sorting domain-containing protein [Prolixibacteraceae bacterium]